MLILQATSGFNRSRQRRREPGIWRDGGRNPAANQILLMASGAAIVVFA